MLEVEKLFDQKLADTANFLEALPSHTYGNTRIPYTGETALQVFDHDQTLLWHSNTAPKTPLAPFKTGFSEQNFSGYRWRTLVQQNPGGRWILVGERLDRRYHLADSIIIESVLPTVLSIPLVGILVWLIIGRGLNSLQLLASLLSSKHDDDLSPLKLNDPPQELLPLLYSTNSLLSRLTASLERERRFSSDAAHELRTPLSALQLHVYNLKQSLPYDTRQQLAKIDNDLKRMEHLVEQILTLYRTTPEHYPAKFESLDLYKLARECIAECYPGFEARAQSISLTGEKTTLFGDRFALHLLIKNLLTNANKYTPENGQVSVDVRFSSNFPLLVINDSGPGIAAEERERVFERFYRAGGDCHASEVNGCGLGLSIVAHIAQLHHAIIRFTEPSWGAGLSVQIHFINSPAHGNGDIQA